jgi:hypothetical protein
MNTKDIGRQVNFGFYEEFGKIVGIIIVIVVIYSTV